MKKHRHLQFVRTPSASIDAFFSKDASLGLYCTRVTRYNKHIQFRPIQKDYPHVAQLESHTAYLKKCLYVKGSETILFGDFMPSSNVKYYVYSKDEDDVHLHYLEEEAENTYPNLLALAQEIAKDRVVIIVALQTQAIQFKDIPTAFHPFQITTDETTFFYKRSHGAFSFLYPPSIQEEMNQQTNLNFQQDGGPYGLFIYFPMGYASLGLYQRIELYRNGERFNYSKPPKSNYFHVFERYGTSERFEAYTKAKAFVEKKQARSTLGVEYIIAAEIEHLNWH